MPSLTVENYLKAIWQIAATTRESSVSTGKLAQSLKVSPGTVTSMQKALPKRDSPNTGRMKESA